MNRALRSKSHAFTIVEILIALTIFGLILFAIYSSWTSILRAAAAGRNAAADAQRGRMTIRCLEEAFTTAELFNENVAHYAFLTDYEGDFSAVSMVSRLSPTFPGNGQFGEVSLRRISFSVERSTNGDHVLIMRQVPMLMVTNRPEDIYSLVLARHVRAFDIKYWNPGIEDFSTEWIYTNQLPQLVQIYLEVGDENGKKKQAGAKFATLVSVAATNFTANMMMGMPGGGMPPPGPPPGSIPGRGGVPRPGTTGPGYQPPGSVVPPSPGGRFPPRRTR